MSETGQANMTQAIFGATGGVGKALAAELAKNGIAFRVIGRSEGALQRALRCKY